MEWLYSDGGLVTWLRNGSCPELTGATFSATTNGADYTGLGAGSRIAGGWQVDAASLPTNADIFAQGFVTGSGNSSWFVQAGAGPPIILTQPQSTTVNAGVSAGFKVVTTAAGTLSYQWYKNGAPLADSAETGILGSQTAMLGVIHPYGAAAGESGLLSATSPAPLRASM